LDKRILIAGIRPDWLCVCSDQTVSDDQDDFVSNIYDLGIDVTTDKKDIRKFLTNKNNNLKIVFTTYQSGKVTAQGAKGFTFDLGIMDEAHKTVGHGEKPMAHLIHQKNIKIKNRLFMTATERLFRGDKDEYVSMDDPRDYGEIIYQLSFKAAIEMKPPIISDYKIITFGITAPEIEAVYNDNKFIQVKKEIDNITAREFATAIALRKAIRKLGIRNAISFHSSIKRANNFKKQQELISKVYKQYGTIKTFHVSGAMATSQRASQMREFAEGKGLMTNARCLTEGVDLPAIDCVVFTDPKRSKVDIVQAAGRALRLSKGKKFGYILIPILISEDENATEAAKDTAFEDIVATVRALATQDTRIVDYLRAVSSGTIPKGGSPIKELTKLNVLTKVNEEEFNKSIQLKVWDRVAFGNWRSYEEAKKYVQLNRIRSQAQWFAYTKSDNFPKDIRKNPRQYKEFSSMGDFLGTGSLHTKSFRSYKEAKKIIQSLNINSSNHYYKLRKENKLPADIRANPREYNEFEGWGVYLGTGNIAFQLRKYTSFIKAKKYAQSLKLKNISEWYKHTKQKNLPDNVPSSPNQVYRKIWKGWGNFLGTNYIASRDRVYRSYEEAKKYAFSRYLKNRDEWMNHSKSKNFPKDIPLNIPQTYKNKFEGWGAFLGTGYTAPRLRKYTSFIKAKKYAKSLKLKNRSEWFKMSMKKKLPKNIPTNVDKIYKKQWKSWGNFLGTGLKKGQTYTKLKQGQKSSN
jgi:superfamily II DNA or RNA helicase